ncbi:MAG: TrkH family potassium uptake protein, partial [Desulfuromonadales bacterium]|nr:TrkH family potassium uptake protein [Desulfuromonadales bacterium]NIS43028.1 TrkH family potassium uptake protein [Desulfuromonadales bacterium]
AFIGVVFLSWLPFLYYGYNPLDALFEVVSATATVGLSSGITDGAMPVLLKYVLCADMLFGRLEFIAWMVLLYPRTWFGRKRRS